MTSAITAADDEIEIGTRIFRQPTALPKSEGFTLDVLAPRQLGNLATNLAVNLADNFAVDLLMSEAYYRSWKSCGTSSYFLKT